MQKAGFIGLGSQGSPMARRMLDAGYDIVLWARRPQTLAPFAETHAAVADSIAALGIDRDAFTQLINVSSGGSFSFDVRARMSKPQDFLHLALSR